MRLSEATYSNLYINSYTDAGPAQGIGELRGYIVLIYFILFIFFTH